MAIYTALKRAVVVCKLLQDALYSGERAQLEECLAWAECLRLAAFRNVVRTLKRHHAGVWAYVETKMTNGLMAAVSALLQLAKRIARGFRNFHSFRLAAYVRASGLILHTPRLLPT